MFSIYRRQSCRQELPLAQSNSVRSIACSSSYPSVASSSRTSIRSIPSGRIRRRSSVHVRSIFHILIFSIGAVLLISERNNLRLSRTHFIPVQGQSIKIDNEPQPKFTSSDVTLVKVIDGIPIHPVGEVVFDVIRAFNIQSLIDYPCRNHRDITPSVIRLLHADVNFNLSTFEFVCIDKDSRQLAIAHSVLRNAFEDNYDAIPRSRYLRYSFERTHAFGLNSKRIPQAELFLSWTNGYESDSDAIRNLIVRARATNAKLAIVGAYPIIGATWEPSADLLDFAQIATARTGSFSHTPYPFSDALMAVSRGYDPHRSVLLYNLSVLPYASTGSMSMKHVVEQDMILERSRKQRILDSQY